MKKLIFLPFIAFIVFFLIPVQSQASHMMGSDIGWKCLGGDSFLVKVTIYRDCNGCTISEVGGSCSTVPLRLKPSCGGSRTYSLNATSVTDITPVCASSCTRCTQSSCGFPYGVQKIVLSQVINLSADTCCEFNLSISISSRNSNITTGAANLNFFVEATLNKCIAPCDNAPTFSTEPIQLLCKDQCIVISQGAMDQDGDSLVFSLTPPLTGPNLSNVTTWNSPYSFEKPVKFNGFPNSNLNFSYPDCKGFHLDSFTGEFKFRPTIAEITVCAFKVEEYRNGIKIGEIRRDMQWIIFNCPANDPPILSGIDSTPSVLKTTCVGGTACFTIYANDPNLTDTISWNFDTLFAGASFVTDTPYGRAGTFCWTPQISDTGMAHNFTITASDNKCPMPATTSKSYGIKVFEDSIIVVDAGSDFSICKIDTIISLAGTPLGGIWSGKSVYSNSFNPAIMDTGTHPLIYKVQNGTCVFQDTMFVTVHPKPNPQIAASTTFGLRPLKVIFTGSSANGISSWLWDFGDMATDITQNTQHTYTTTDSFDVQLVVQDSLGCRDTLLKKDYIIVVDSLYPINDFSACIYDSAITLHGFPAGGTWSGAGIQDTLFDPAKAGVGVHWLVYSAMINGWIYKDSVQAIVRPRPYTSFTASPITGSFILSVNFNNNSLPNMAQYNWDFGDNTASSVQQPSHLYTSPGNYDVKLEAVDSIGCSNSFLRRNYIRISNPLNAGNDFSICQKDPTIELTSGTPKGGIWSGTGVKADSLFNPKIAVPGMHWLYYTYTTQGISFTDSLEVTVKPAPAVNFSASPLAGTVPLKVNFIGTGSSNIKNWSWDFGDMTTAAIKNPAHNYTVADTYTVKLQVVDSLGCTDSLVKQDYVVAIDQIDAGNDFYACLDGSPKPLSGHPAGGTWVGPGISGSQFNPGVAGIGMHRLVYTKVVNGIPFRDTVSATVPPLPRAGFTASPLSGSLPLTVQFTDTSIGNIAKWKWNFGDANTWDIQHPSHDYYNPGIYDVSLAIEDSYTCTDSVTVPAMINVFVGIEEKDNSTVFLVFPNPVKNEVTIKTTSECRNCRIQLINAAGNIVRDEVLTQPELRLQRDGLPAGAYLLKLISGNVGQNIKKIVFE